MTKVPLACTLGATDASARVREWREFLRVHVLEVQRTKSMTRLRLMNAAETVLVATDLARREKTCCAFFEFRLSILADALWLEVATCDDSGISLADLSFLADDRT